MINRSAIARRWHRTSGLEDMIVPVLFVIAVACFFDQH